MNNLFVILNKAVKEWLKDDASLLAAALAYYGLFSFVPLLILTLILFNSLFQHGFLDGQVVATSQDLLGQQMPKVADDLIDRASDQASSFRFTLLNIGLLVFGAAGLFVHTRRAFHIIWKIPDKVVPLMDTIFTYLHSYLLIALVAFLLLATSIFTALLRPVGTQIEEYLPIRTIIEDLFKVAKGAYFLRALHRYSRISVTKFVSMNVLLRTHRLKPLNTGKETSLPYLENFPALQNTGILP